MVVGAEAAADRHARPGRAESNRIGPSRDAVDRVPPATLCLVPPGLIARRPERHSAGLKLLERGGRIGPQAHAQTGQEASA